MYVKHGFCSLIVSVISCNPFLDYYHVSKSLYRVSHVVIIITIVVLQGNQLILIHLQMTVAYCLMSLLCCILF